MQKIFAAVILAGIIVCATAVNERCGSVEECADAGETCLNGFCRCWTDQGPQISEIWSCNSDNTCALSFPGHVCRISRECSRTQGRLGYCQPIGAIRAAPTPTAKPLGIKAGTATTAPTVTVTQPTASPTVAPATAATAAHTVAPTGTSTAAPTTGTVTTVAASTAASTAPPTTAPSAGPTTMRSVGGYGGYGRRR